MDPVQNPYAPGAGRRPPELAGRGPEVDRFEVLADRLQAGRSDRGLILSGLRGVGKTVLLNEFHGSAARRGWVAGLVEAGDDGLATLVARALHPALRALARTDDRNRRIARALRAFKSFSLKVAPDGSLALGIDLDPEAGLADTGHLETDLTDLVVGLGEALAERRLGVLLAVDEMQDLPADELGALAAASHRATQMDLPFVVVGAGLPNLPEALTNAKSYAERLYEYVALGPLGPDDARTALRNPAKQLGVDWTADALDAITARARGYPYFLQVYGNATWNAATGRRIDRAAVEVGVDVARQELNVGFFGTRWARATAAQQRYLRVVATFGDGPVSSSEVAATLGRPQSSLSAVRSELIKKGLLYPTGRGALAFTVPGMAEFIVARAPRDD
jgi:hypothetical protein